MSRTIRFHLDENCPKGVASGLRRLGIDVTRHNDVGLGEATDEEHVEFARAERRVLFTQGRDLLTIASSGVPHHGIVFSAQGRRSIGEIIEGLSLI